MAKKKTTKKSQGLGDTVEKITTKTGIKKLVKFIAGDDCGCDKRKEKLNKLFSYAPQIECLKEDEFNYLENWFSIERNSVTPIEQADLRKIYNRTFNKKTSPSSCSSCVRDMVDRLRTLYKEYESKN